MKEFDDLVSFYRTIWGTDTQGFVYIPVLDDYKVMQRAFFRWPNDEADIVRYTLSNSIQGKNVFYSPALWKSTTIQGNEGFLQCRVLYIDVDGNPPDWWPDDDGPIRDGDGQPVVLAGPPSVVVQTSEESHQHAYWVLDTPVTDWRVLEAMTRSLAYTFRVDKTGWDASQVLRPPGTHNYIHDLPVQTLSHDGTVYPSQAFAADAKSVKELMLQVVDDTGLPAVAQVLAAYQWDPDTVDILTKGIEVGSRSSALMRIGFEGAELGASDSEIYAMLLAADDQLGKFVNRADRKKRLMDIVNRARTQHPHALDSFTGQSLLSKATNVDTAPVAMPLRDFLAMPYSTSWAVTDAIAEDSLVMVASKSGVGKTQWVTQFALHQASGRPFCGYEFVKPMRGMFFSLEMSAPSYQKFIKTMCHEYTPLQMDLISTNFIVVPHGRGVPLPRPEGRAWFESLLEEHNPSWVVVDALHSVFKDLLDAARSSAFFEYLQSVARRFNCYVLIIHHSRKNVVAGEGDLDRIFGDTYITALLDTAWVLAPTEVPIGGLKVIEAKNRLSSNGLRPEFLIERTHNLNFKMFTQLEETINGQPQRGKSLLERALGDSFF